MAVLTIAAIFTAIAATILRYSFLHHKKTLLISVLLLFSPIISYPSDYQDTEIKAALLYKILFFVDLKTENNAKELNVCVLGNDIFSSFKKNLEQREVEGKKIKVTNATEDNFVKSNCHVLFIGESYKSTFKKIIETPSPILTVSDITQFAKNGGMIGFTNFNSTIQLEINLKALEKANLKIDSNLLEVALHVY